MAGGITTTESLQDSIPHMIVAARITREQEGDMMSLVDRQTLGKGMGKTWNEVGYQKLTAQSITNTTVLDNPQQLSDTNLPITPSQIAIHTFILDEVGERIIQRGPALFGALNQNAMRRKKNIDGITAMDGFTTSLGGSGTLAHGHINAASTRITGNTTEPGSLPIHCVLHDFQIKDLFDEVVASVGTYEVTSGMTVDVFKNGFTGKVINRATIHSNGDIPIVSNVAKGGVFSRDALVLVQGRSPRAVAVRDEATGGGGTNFYHYDEYSYGERSSGNWGYEIQSDATVPTD